MYVYLVTNYFNPEILTTVVWSVVAEVLINGIMALLVQFFFVFRAWRLSGGNYLLSLPIAAVSLAEFGVIIGYVIQAYVLKTSADSLPHIPNRYSASLADYSQAVSLKALSLTVNALTAVADTGIALVLYRLLWQSRTSFRRTDTMITKLIVFAVYQRHTP